MLREETTFPTPLTRPALKLFGGTPPDAPHAPATAYGIVYGVVNGTRCRLRHWTAAEWHQLPIRERPNPALPDQRGGYFGLEPAPD